MKKKSLLYFLPVLLLASCSASDPIIPVYDEDSTLICSYTETKSLKDSLEAVKNLAEVSTSSFETSIEGQIQSFNKFQEFSKKSIPSDDLANNLANRSKILRIPLRISETSFLPANICSDDQTNYNYYRIKTKLTGENDPNTVLQFKKDGDDLVFFCEGLSKSIAFYSVLTYSTELTGDNYDSVELYGRFNITLRYNNEGLLTNERVYIPGTSGDKRVDVTSTFTYSI
ncbi:MAG: hypothetical protein WCR67_00180 [Bacilli bacterium]